MKQAIKNAIDTFRIAADTAEAFYEKAEGSGLRFPLALSAYLVREFDIAIQILQDNIKESQEGQHEAQLSLCYFRKGEMDEAESWIRKAISISSKGSIRAHLLKRDLPYMSVLGRILLAQGKAIDAAAAAQLVLNENPKEELALITKGLSKMAMGELDAAKELFVAALNSNSAEFEVRASNMILEGSINEYLNSVEQLLNDNLNGIPATMPIAVMRAASDV